MLLSCCIFEFYCQRVVIFDFFCSLYLVRTFLTYVQLESLIVISDIFLLTCVYMCTYVCVSIHTQLYDTSLLCV